MMITLPKRDQKIKIVRNALILILWIEWHQVITSIQLFIFVLEIDVAHATYKQRFLLLIIILATNGRKSGAKSTLERINIKVHFKQQNLHK